MENSSADEDIQRAFYCQRDHLERTVNSLKTRLAKSADEHEKVYVKIMKVNYNTWKIPLIIRVLCFFKLLKQSESTAHGIQYFFFLRCQCENRFTEENAILTVIVVYSAGECDSDY